MCAKEIWTPPATPASSSAMLAALLQILAFTIVAVAALWPGLRGKAAALLLAIGTTIAVLAGMEGGLRSLTITHSFPAYVELTVQSKDFVVETIADQPALRWGLLMAAFCVGWAVWLLMQRSRGPARAFGTPVVLAWTGIALQLLLERAAAPAEMVQPASLSLDRALFPATLVGALLLARPGRKILHLVFYLSLLVAVTRLPVAVFGTLATQHGWGTHLDVHRATYFVPPGTGIGIEVQPGDSKQLFWMVWAPHLILFPAVYMMSTGGFAFLLLMWRRQKQEDRRQDS